MKALILGADGQLGQALQRGAHAEWDVTALTRSDLEIANYAALHRAIADAQPELVINAAAYTAVDAAEDNESEAFLINGQAPPRIASACTLQGATLVHISTDYVFDGRADCPYPTGAAINPLNVYGRSKRAGEEAVLTHDDALVVRTSSLYSAHGRNFVTTILRLLQERDSINVVADQISVPTHASSLARAIWMLAGDETTGLHHFTDSGRTSWFEFANAIAVKARAAGLRHDCQINPVTSDQYGAAAVRPAFSVLDCSATWSITGVPKHWEEELDIMLAEWMAAR